MTDGLEDVGAAIDEVVDDALDEHHPLDLEEVLQQRAQDMREIASTWEASDG